MESLLVYCLCSGSLDFYIWYTNSAGLINKMKVKVKRLPAISGRGDGFFEFYRVWQYLLSLQE